MPGWFSSLTLTSKSTLPSLPAGVSCLQLASGHVHSLALLSNGGVLAWGANTYGQLAVPVLPAGLSYVEVAAGYDHSIARRRAEINSAARNGLPM